MQGDEDYECVVVIEGQETLLHATLDRSKETGTHVFKCATHKVPAPIKTPFISCISCLTLNQLHRRGAYRAGRQHYTLFTPAIRTTDSPRLTIAPATMRGCRGNIRRIFSHFARDPNYFLGCQNNRYIMQGVINCSFCILCFKHLYEGLG